MTALTAWAYGLQWYEVVVIALLFYAIFATALLLIVVRGTEGDD